jgi:23S rRNA (cytosine1962-C5)-methyltransferase
MNDFPKIFLQSGRDRSIKRFHLWIFSGAVKRIEGKPVDGDVVEVFSASGNYLATGHYQNGSIMVRVFSFVKTLADKQFWTEKIERAINYRQALGFFGRSETNVFRLIHGEGDNLPGLVVDYYNGVVVLQAHSVGMYRSRALFAEIILNLLGTKAKVIYDRSETTLNIAGEDTASKILAGNIHSDSTVVSEYGNQFEIDFRQGQKTGFFIDQRENRKLLEKYCKGKRVANIFSYSGGFSVYAEKGGAAFIDSVDASEKAMELAAKNMELNFGKKETHRYFAMDAFECFKSLDVKYDVVVLDPPAFAKHRQALNNALKAYRRINEIAIINMNPGSILFTFSCSQVVSRADFRTAVFSAAANTGRNIRIMHQLTQPEDHPINIFHPEGEYLKGLVVFVE